MTHLQRLEYQREWHRKHKEHNKQYYEQNKERIKAYCRQYYKDNKWKWEDFYRPRAIRKGADEIKTNNNPTS